MKVGFNSLILVALLWMCSGCGVKGDPVAPATPAELGRGKPLYKAEEDAPSQLLQKQAPETENPDDSEYPEQE